MSKESDGRRGGRSPLTTLRATWTAWRRLSQFFVRSRGQIVLVAIVSVGAGLAEAALLTLIASLAISLAEQKSLVEIQVAGLTLSSGVTIALILGVALAVVRGLLQLWVAYLPARMSGEAMVDLRTRLFDAFVGAEWSVKASEREGGFQSVMINQVRATAEAIIVLGALISSAFMFLTMLASAVAMSPATAGLITVLSLVLFAGLRPLASALRRSAKSLSSENIEYAKTTQEVAALAEETQVFGATGQYRSRFYRQLRAVQAPFERVRFLAGAVPALYQSVALLVLVVALGVIAMVGASELTTLGAVVLILVRAVTYGQRIQQGITSMDEKIPFMNHLADAIDKYERHPQLEGETPVAVIDRLRMTNVSYAYAGSSTGVTDITFEAEMGEVIGIVGPSGAGKSTLTQLLLRLRIPTAGSYLAGDTESTRISRDSWRRLVSYVPQSPQLIYGTIRENIRFFREEISDRDVELAAVRAHLHDEIMAMPDGYDTVVGSRASKVSGGQRQRLCIARALAAKPTVMILDEPTSALDVKSEASVQQTLQELAGASLVFLVAHRLSTLAICDRIMVIVDGRIDAFDTAERLLETNAYFREVSAISRGDEPPPAWMDR